MTIRIEHGRPETIIAAARRAGEAQAAIRAQEKAERLQAQQMEFDFRQSLRQQDMVIDLQMQERAKMWEIQKMELRSQMDFQREEQQRSRKLDSIDSAIQQIDKEVLAGRITEQEAYPIKQKLELSKSGVSVPISAFAGDEGERFGVQPYWMKGRDAPEGTPERQLYETKIAEGISGERRGTVPWDLDARYIRTAAAEESRVNRGIFLEPEDIEEFIEMGGGVTELPLGDKELDVGVRAQPTVERDAERSVAEGLPVVTSDADYAALPSGTEFTDQSGKRWRKP